MRVRNRHRCANVAGIEPLQTGDVDPSLLDRYHGLLVPLDADEPDESEDAGASEEDRLSAREAKRAIRESEDPDEIRAFIGDPRSSVHNVAVRRLRTVTGG